jgi:hypothetical protein
METNETSFPLQPQVLDIPDEIPILPVMDMAIIHKMDLQ